MSEKPTAAANDKQGEKGLNDGNHENEEKTVSAMEAENREAISQLWNPSEPDPTDELWQSYGEDVEWYKFQVGRRPQND